MIIQQMLKDYSKWLSQLYKESLDEMEEYEKADKQLSDDAKTKLPKSVKALRAKSLHEQILTLPKFNTKEKYLNEHYTPMAEAAKSDADISRQLPDNYYLPYPSIVVGVDMDSRIHDFTELGHTYMFFSFVDQSLNSDYTPFKTNHSVDDGHTDDCPCQTGYIVDGFYYTPEAESSTGRAAFTIFADTMFVNKTKGIGYRLRKTKDGSAMFTAYPEVSFHLGAARTKQEHEWAMQEREITITCWAAINALLLSQAGTQRKPKLNSKMKKILERNEVNPKEWEYHELVIGRNTQGNRVPSEYCAAPDHQGGTHASPREHERRGHFRTLGRGTPNERKVWIEPVTVCADSPRGRIDKDYTIQGVGKTLSGQKNVKTEKAPYRVEHFYQRNPYEDGEKTNDQSNDIPNQS